MFKFKIKTDLRFGKGITEEINDMISELDYKQVGVIVDNGVIKNRFVETIILKLEQSKKLKILEINNSVEPDYDFLESFKKKFDGLKLDSIVGIGGGSTLDLTKAIATLLNNQGPAISFRGFPNLKNKPLPVIAIPTTGGTGSEVTYNAVFTDSKGKKKLGINSEYNYPILAIIDPNLTINCPPSVTVSSGADALVHTLESFVHKENTPLSRMLSKQAFFYLFNNLSKVLDNPNSSKIRGEIALGAYLAGMALVNSGSGPSGAFSYPLGVHYKIPHGYAGAVFLPEVTRFNVNNNYLDYDSLYDMIENSDLNLSRSDKCKLFVDKIFELMVNLGIKEKIKTYSLSQEDVDFMVDQYDYLKGAINQNPVELTKEDCKEIIYNALGSN